MATISTFACVIIFTFALLAISIDGRKEVGGKYWRNVMHESGTSNEVVNVDVFLPEEKADCDELSKNMEHKKHNNFEPRPNTWKLKVEKKISFSNDFEPRPNLSIYDKDGKPSVNEFFEPRPNVSSYGGDSDNNGLKEENKFIA
ncbi:hypothetical protein LIER_40193 [Lithospermum erythrorhizon]|uniref:Organ specific protein n=1 Tax=Lithospermum erythrorhizon TaxID=34254 RepID=A0AAV3QV06_LITER